MKSKLIVFLLFLVVSCSNPSSSDQTLIPTAAPPPIVAEAEESTRILPPTWTSTPVEQPDNQDLPPTWTPIPEATVAPTSTSLPSPTSRFSTYPLEIDKWSKGWSKNMVNDLGCDWVGIVGSVISKDEGKSVSDVTYIIHVYGNGIDEWVETGSFPPMGPSGWGVTLGDHPFVATYRVQAFTLDREPASTIHEFSTRDECKHAQALVLFRLTK